jgi:hypothetical protein
MTAPIDTDRARELAKRWAKWHEYASTPRDVRPELAPTNSLGPCELADLLAWVRARMAGEVAERKAFEAQAISAGIWAASITGEQPPIWDPLDREALADAVGRDLGLDKGDGTKATASDWTLCELAGWPS